MTAQMSATNFLIPQPQRNFGANEKTLKIRMKSVNNIRKITKAMKMVAASKMRGDLTRLQRGKDFGANSVDMMFKTDTYMQRRIADMTSQQAEPRELIVPLSSDKGLCGGINSGIMKDVRSYVESRPNRSKCSIFSIGDKGTIAITRPMPDLLKVGVSEISTPYNYPTVMALAEHIIQQGE
mgnify:CR=1 FL=1